MFKIKVLLVDLSKLMWPKVSFYALLAIVTAFVTIFASPSIPEDLADSVGANAVGSILNILASSMLAVTTFSLTTIVSAYGTASSGATPRATLLLRQDATSKNVLATFLGVFLYSLVGIIALNIGIYSASGRFVLFIVTIAVIILIVITLIKWIEHLTRLGRLSETTRMVEEVAVKELKKRAKAPYMEGAPLYASSPLPVANVVRGKKCGYIQYVDVQALSEIAEKMDTRIYVQALPGTFVTPFTKLALVEAEVMGKKEEEMAKAFVLDDERSFEQDPRFGVCVLAEIAERALSEGINDPGTAIDVVTRLARVLSAYQPEEPDEILYPRILVPPLEIDDLFDDAFHPLVRDASGTYEVQVIIQKVLAYMHSIDNKDFRTSALKYSQMALERMDRKRILDYEVEKIRSLAVAG